MRAALAERSDDVDDGLGGVGRRGRAAALIVDDAEPVALGAEPQHRLDEIAADRAVDPRRPQDDMAVEALGDGGVARRLAGAIDRTGIDRVVLGVGAHLGAVEDVVRGKMDEGGADLAARIGQRGRAVAVDREGHVGLAFGLVDRGIGGGVDDDVRPHAGDVARDRVGSREIDLVALDKVDLRPGRPGAARELVADLADPADHQDAFAHREILHCRSYDSMNGHRPAGSASR